LLQTVAVARVLLRIGLVLASLDPVAAVMAPGGPPAAPAVTIDSPGRSVSLTIDVNAAGQLTWAVRRGSVTVLEPSALGIRVDGVDLGKGAAIEKSSAYRIDEKYPWRGLKSEAINRANGARIAVRHSGGQSYTIDARVFDDGVAVRHEVQGTGRRVPDAATSFTLPAGSTVWTHGLRGHYEELYEKQRVEDVPAGAWAGPPVTFKLRGGGYGSITEADLRGYAGMALQADGGNTFRERLGHDHPPSYPFTLRFGDEEAKRLSQPAAIDGPIRTPWRVVFAAADLNALVNSDIVHNVSAPPDPKLFPQGVRTPWLKPGRAVWRYLDGGENSFAGIKEFSRLAGELGFEYQVVEGLWTRFGEAELKELVEYSRERNVGIVLWRHRRSLGDPEERRRLFGVLSKAGVVGLKVDFLDHEAKEVIDLYQDILRDAAEFKLVIDFHGANKPAGEARTWPNELTREGIYGLEHKAIKEWASFNATFPFARMLAGHADYTPVVFGERRRETSWAHQIASAAILTSPLLIYGGHPQSLLSNPAVEIIRTLPAAWDETRVLPPSEIGEVAVFARRTGATWFVAAMNGPGARTVTIDPAALGIGGAQALVARDKLDDPAAVEIDRRAIARGQAIEIPMRAAGGFVVRLTR
jgi:alpha-glucosidase